jgi:hypothetical protein
MEMTVVKPVVAVEVGGRGSKRRRKREGLQRGERNRRWLLVVDWWLCWLPVVELMVGRPVMRVVVAEGHGGEKGRGKREKFQKQGKWLVFWLILDPIFSSLRPSNPPLFIGGGREKSFLQWRKISALDSDGKDPNRWLKVGMVHCQIVKSAAAGCLSWPLWGGATSVYLPLSW